MTEQLQEINELLSRFPGLRGVRVEDCPNYCGDCRLVSDEWDNERKNALTAVFIFANFGREIVQRIAFGGGVMTRQSVTAWLVFNEFGRPNE